MLDKPSKGFGRFVFGKLSLCLALAVGGSALASARTEAAVESAGQAETRRVEIRVSGSPAAVVRTRATAEELFGRAGLRVLVVDRDREAEAPRVEEPARVIVYVDLSLPIQPRLVILDGLSGRELDRRDLPTTTSLETSVEAVMHVTYSVVESLLELNPVPTGNEPPPPAETPTPVGQQKDRPAPAREVKHDRDRSKRDAKPAERVEAPAPTGREWGPGVDAGPAFSSVGLGAGRVLPGGGLVVEGRWGAPIEHFGVWLAGSVHTSSEIRYGGASVGLRPIAGRLLVTYDLFVMPSAALLFGLGGGMDGYRIEKSADAADVEVTSRAGAVDPLGSALAGARLQLSGRTCLTAAGALDVDLMPSRFTMVGPGVSRVVLDLPRLRPSAWVYVSFSFGSHSRFADPGERG